MQLVKRQRIAVFTPTKQELYYRLDKGESQTLKASKQVLHVLTGTVWVSNKGEDFVLKAGEAITLLPGGDNVVTVSSLKQQNASYSIR